MTLLSPGRRRAIGHGLIVAGLLFLAYVFAVVAPSNGYFGSESYAYWLVSLPDPYSIPWLYIGSFAYTPPVAVAFDPFGAIEWWVFSFLWLMLLVGSVIWIGWSPLWVLAAFAFPPVALDLYGGNIHILLAVAVVLGFSHPWTWSFVLLTKPTLGIGLLWFVVRGEWRSLAVALGTTAVLAGAVFAWMPQLWADWLDYVVSGLGQPAGHNAVGVPLWIRLALGVALVVWGARTDRRWTVVVAATLAMPSLWFGALAMLIGVIPEIRERSPIMRGRRAFGWRLRSVSPDSGSVR